ncbi:MAG: hypothetical protein ACRDRN_07470 [Sciscionella sp.]
MLTTSRQEAVAGTDPEEAGSRTRYRLTVVTVVLVVAAFGVLIYQRRWISDDGLIVVREVREILAGNGPNYNPFQRDEVDTSPLWTWLLAAFAVVFRFDVAVDAVVLGWLCSVIGLAVALAGSARFHRLRGTRGQLVPAGALVPLGVAAFWDFGTSGLENGLSMLWLGTVWWLAVAVTDGGSRRGFAAVAIVLGLGPLVRPDFTLATIVFGIALLMIARPGWRRGLACCAAACVLPVGYEIFRMGYYGLTVPMPALAKEASDVLWAQGLTYLDDFFATYQLWIPLALICVAGARALGRYGVDRRTAILICAPIVSGVLLGGYVARVGGDYMHGRMWLPVVFVLLLPVMLIPIGRKRVAESIGVAGLVIWALMAGLAARTPYHGMEFGPNGVTNERSYEVAAFSNAHPTTTASRTVGNGLKPELARLTAGDNRPLAISGGVTASGPLWVMPLSTALPDHSAFFYNNMGIADAAMPVDGTVIDVNGLATPLAGHLQLTQHGRPGHEKWLPVAWVIASYAAPSAIATMPENHGATRAQVLAARHALSCGALKQMVTSVDQPMSIGRFWHNLTGAITRTSMRVPADPFAAQRQFCD